MAKAMGTSDHQLPQDLVREILSRLAVKCLIRFLCVCKSWSRLIRHPGFIQLHLSHANKATSPRKLLVRPSLTGWNNYFCSVSGSNYALPVVEEFSLPLQPGYDGLTGSCNGLVCRYQSSGPLVSLFNPATKQVKDLPPSPNVRGCWINLRAIVGFGYDRKAEDLKVVRTILGAFDDDDDDDVLFEVYSLAHNTWREIQPAIDPSPLQHFFRCFWSSHTDQISSADGVCYWLNKYQPDSTENRMMLSFGFSDEVFEAIPLPRGPHLDVKSVGFFHGCLSVISYQWSPFHYSIWVRCYNDENKKNGWHWKERSFRPPGGCFSPTRLWDDKVVFEKSTGLVLVDPSYAIEAKEILPRYIKTWNCNVKRAWCTQSYRSTEYAESLVLFQ